MMQSNEPYGTVRGVEAAIKDAAKKAEIRSGVDEFFMVIALIFTNS